MRTAPNHRKLMENQNSFFFEILAASFCDIAKGGSDPKVFLTLVSQGGEKSEELYERKWGNRQRSNQ